MDDLEDFIANIEQSAPKEELIDALRCQECDTILEEIDGDYICPNCSAKATNILQLEETELHFDAETGRAVFGQRVVLANKRTRCHNIDYGWAWSTDEAIVHILDLQLDALEKAGLLAESFRRGVKNMWLKFWIEYIAPYIKDEYNENELIPMTITKAMKFRDIEVLVKVKDKVMIPQRVAAQRRPNRKYSYMGTSFYKAKPDDSSSSSLDSDSDAVAECMDDPNRSLVNSQDEDEVKEQIAVETSQLDLDLKKPRRSGATRHMSRDSITILTLNRTLAFIEAASRCMNSQEPLFASDIVRACNNRLIPFFGAHKTLPEGMRLNSSDKLMFQKTRPPSPEQLTRAASLLIHRLYQDKLPFLMPVPKLDRLIQRLVTDMNLPYELSNLILSRGVDFTCFFQTRPLQYHSRNKSIRYSPQFDRWAFAILTCQLKRLFNLNDKNLGRQAEIARRETLETGDSYFVFSDWARQMSMRLQLIGSYDPYMLFHPMTDIKNVQFTPQLRNYIETILADRASTTTRSQANRLRSDEAFRSEFCGFLWQEIPRPDRIGRDWPEEKELEKAGDIKYPIQDAFSRTRRFWIDEVSDDQEVSSLLFKDFTHEKICTESKPSKWSLYDVGCPSSKARLEIAPDWPYTFKLLLSVGAYLCYCEPRELLREVKHVEQYMYPHVKVMRRRQACLNKSKDEL